MRRDRLGTKPVVEGRKVKWGERDDFSVGIVQEGPTASAQLLSGESRVWKPSARGARDGGDHRHNSGGVLGVQDPSQGGGDGRVHS